MFIVGWPAFQFQLFLYDVASGVSMKIPYKLTDCQYETLMEHYTTTSSITLDDHRKVTLSSLSSLFIWLSNSRPEFL